MRAPDTFVLTDDHIKLLRRACVGWQDCETGAPEINPKRPYGNSDVETDVAEILGWTLAVDRDGEEALSRFQQEAAEKLHRETEMALGVVLSTGAFVPGRYVREPYSSEWRPADES